MKDGISFSVDGAIFNECYFMALDFTHVIYERCSREANVVAHKLASLARPSSPSIWMDDGPSEHCNAAGE